MRRFAAQDRRVAVESLDKETTSHRLAPDSGQCYTNRYSKQPEMCELIQPHIRRILFRVVVLLLGITAAAPVAAAGEQPRTVIVDTDVGSDDLMAIAFLLSRTDVRIEAITVTNGLAHVRAGAANLVRLLELTGKTGIPVYMGRETPLRGTAAFPEEWRTLSDTLPGVPLPAATRAPQSQSAAEYLARRLRDHRHPVPILALGPLTNLAEVLAREPSSVRGIRELVIMGGAVRVPGNLGDGGYFKTDNKTAEWNMFVDPFAARTVFRSGAPIRLIPLDATNKVPIDLAFLREFQSAVHAPLGKFVAQILETDRKFIEQGIYSAWDPLAAAALVEPAVVTAQALAIDVRQQRPQEGRTVEVRGRRPNAQVALDANAALFKRIFLSALAESARPSIR